MSCWCGADTQQNDYPPFGYVCTASPNHDPFDPSGDPVVQLDSITGADPEGAHGEADKILLSQVPPEVREAYLRVVERCDWWATA